MEWLERMNESIDYLEEKLCDEIDIEGAAEVACVSKFHFQRMFHMLTGVTVAEYVRKRRLTLAAQELTTSDCRVIDAALKYGYSTPESFSKAFKRLHGVNPSAVQEEGITLEAYPRLSFQIQVKGAENMEYKMMEKEGFEIIGKRIKVSTEDGENFERIPKFWEECDQSGLCDELFKHSGDLGVMGVCAEFDYEQDEVTYMIAIEKPVGGLDIDFDLVEEEVPASTWAVFESIGPIPDAIQDTWQRIFSEWFPSTGYEHAESPELEIYYPGDPSESDYKSEIWIPIKKE